MKDEKGKPTRRALSAQAWGEPVPSTAAEVKKLAKKGTELLEKYHEATDKKSSAPKKTAKPKAAATKKTGGEIQETLIPSNHGCTQGKTRGENEEAVW